MKFIGQRLSKVKKKTRPRPKRRHTFIAVRYNDRNNRNATCFASSKPLCKKSAVMTPDFFSIFLFIIQSGISS